MNRLILSLLIIAVNAIPSQSQEKQVFIIGTMHTVPKVVKKSYKPLLKLAINYNPDAIYVESSMPKDSISWEYLKNGWSKNHQAFYRLSDSLKSTFEFSQRRLDALLNKDFKELANYELDSIIISFAYQRDYANYKFYSYLNKHGLQASKLPTRHEDGDLTFKLALILRIKRIKSMDDQQTNKEYHSARQNCEKDGHSNGDNEINKKINAKDYRRAIIPALFGQLGRHVNSRNSLMGLHRLSTAIYVKNSTKSCTLVERYWNERNQRMARNIATQINEGTEKKNIVIVGASHVIGLEREFKKKYPNIKVKLISD